jgi:hypothetical protein
MNKGLRIEDGWCQYLPLLHRIIADPSQEEAFPVLNERCELREACAYWETLYYLFTALLGWKQLHKGLGWFYSTNKNDNNDPLLRLVRSLWDRYDQLDYFAAWAWTQVYCSTPDDISPAAICIEAAYGDENWWRTFKRKGCLYANDPFYKGTNSLHLRHSESFGRYDVATGSPALYSNLKKNKAVVIADHFTTWRNDLEMLGTKLPPIGERSWYVEVFDRQVGHLGLFRQSRETGLWFMGKHSLHMQGN